MKLTNRTNPNTPSYPPQGNVPSYPPPYGGGQPLPYPNVPPFPPPPPNFDPRARIPGTGFGGNYPPYPSQPPNGDPPKPPHKKVKRDWEETISRLITGLLVFFVIVYFGWLFAPRVRGAMTFWPTHTPTPIAHTATAQFTSTVTPLATNTPTLAPTATPGLISQFWISSGKDLGPQLPDTPEGVVVLNVNDSAVVSPALDSEGWTSSDQIVADLGKQLYDQKWYATFQRGSATWTMDQPLRAGLYEIYTMDTMFSSGGTLSFEVRLGGNALTGLTGSQDVVYMTSQYDPIQTYDTWRSLGIFSVPESNELLSVATNWEARDEYTIVAVDRILIVPRKATDHRLLSAIPVAGTVYVYDDLRTEISGSKEYLITQDGQLAWDEDFRVLSNPKEKLKVTYNSVEPLPIGTYQVYAWMPTTRGGIEATVQFISDGKALLDENGRDTQTFLARADESGWEYIGTWTTDKYYERPVKIKVEFSFAEGQSGEYPLDALVLVHNP